LPLQGADGFGVFLPGALLRVELICPFGAIYKVAFVCPRRCLRGEMICPFGAWSVQCDAFGAMNSGLKAQFNIAMGQRPWQNNGIQYFRPVRADYSSKDKENKAKETRQNISPRNPFLIICIWRVALKPLG